MSPQTIRPLTRADDEALSACVGSAGLGGLDDDEVDLWYSTFESDRSLGTWEGDTLIGTAGAYSLQMGVPGNVVPTAGVTLVSVAPTHRRTGVLTRAMHRQLHEIHDAGDESIAALWATEAAIYPRFGYGLAAWRGLGCVRGGPFSPAGAATAARHDDPIRLVPATEGIAHAGPVLDAVVDRTPGMLRRSPEVWLHLAADLRRHGGAAARQWWAVTEGAFARYRLSPHPPGEPGAVLLGEIEATTPAAYAALWRWLLDLDLTDRVESRLLEVHPPVAHLLHDPRLVQVQVQDALWLRVVSVERALAERTFAAPLALTLRLHDDLLTGNDGSWRVEVDDLGAATVTATDTAPDLELGVRELGAAHLGSTPLSALAAAGRVVEHTTGSLRAATRAWAWDVPARCTEVF